MLHIALAFGTLQSGARIIGNVLQLENVKIIGQTRDELEAVRLVKTWSPQVVIVDETLALGGRLVLKALSESHSSCIRILTRDSLPHKDEVKGSIAEADYSFQLPEQINEFSRLMMELSESEVSSV